jgi:hypothetical protein
LGLLFTVSGRRVRILVYSELESRVGPFYIVLDTVWVFLAVSWIRIGSVVYSALETGWICFLGALYTG